MTREMKDSGIEWIGEIPISWDTIQNKYLLNDMYSGGTPTSSNPNFYNDEGIPFVSISDMSGTDYVDSTKKCITEEGRLNKNLKILKPGTIIYSIYATIGAVSELRIPATINQALLALDIKQEMVSQQFYKYCLLGMKDFIFFIANGNTQFNLNAQKVNSFDFPLPPLSEQQQIADFLDEQVSKIDEILEKTKQSIEEYNKLKQAVITQAVTKGLDLNAKMKDSGIDWIGDIPEEWSTTKIFQTFKQVKNKNTGMIESNLLSLSYGHVIRKNINTTDGLLPENFDGYNIIEKDDIVLRLTDLQNDHKSLRVGINSEKGIITSAYLTIRNISNNKSKYFYYLLHTFDICKGFYGMGAGVRQNLNWDELKQLQIIAPSTNEQVEIVDYLDKKTSEIDLLVSKKEQLIKELESYKKSLIYDYVTGKKEVII